MSPENNGKLINDDYTSLLILAGLGVISLISGTAVILNRRIYHARVSKRSLTDIQEEISQKNRDYLRDIKTKIDEIENAQTGSSKTPSPTERKKNPFKRRRR